MSGYAGVFRYSLGLPGCSLLFTSSKYLREKGRTLGRLTLAPRCPSPLGALVRGLGADRLEVVEQEVFPCSTLLSQTIQLGDLVFY